MKLSEFWWEVFQNDDGTAVVRVESDIRNHEVIQSFSITEYDLLPAIDAAERLIANLNSGQVDPEMLH